MKLVTTGSSFMNLLYSKGQFRNDIAPLIPRVLYRGRRDKNDGYKPWARGWRAPCWPKKLATRPSVYADNGASPNNIPDIRTTGCQPECCFSNFFSVINRRGGTLKVKMLIKVLCSWASFLSSFLFLFLFYLFFLKKVQSMQPWIGESKFMNT